VNKIIERNEDKNMLIEKLILKLDDQNFVNRFIENPAQTLQSEFGETMETIMKEVSESGEKYEEFMNKLAQVMDVEFLTAAASTCCS
jgi:hypothetical protein